MEELVTAKSDNNFSSIIFRKFKMNIEQSCYENFYKQKNTQLIINENIKEEHLGTKNLHLNRKNNSQTYIEYYWKKNEFVAGYRIHALKWKMFLEMLFSCYSFKCQRGS